MGLESLYNGCTKNSTSTRAITFGILDFVYPMQTHK